MLGTLFDVGGGYLSRGDRGNDAEMKAAASSWRALDYMPE